MHEREDPVYILGNEPLAIADTVKYRGVFLQRNMKWDTHINATINKASRVLGLLKHTLFDYPDNVKKLAYSTLCRPIIEYGADVWDPYTKDLITKLEVFQNKAIRFNLNTKARDTSMTDLKNNCGIELLESR